MNYNFRQFVFAREYRGYSQTKLASMIRGLSQSNLSNYEKGVDSLSDEKLRDIANVLDFPMDFFSLRINNYVESPHYRRKSGITKQQRTRIEYTDKLIGYIIDQMGEAVEYPEFTFRTIDLEEGFTPEYAAQYTRKLLGLTDGPVDYINKLLEQRGIIIVETSEDEDIFDGVSFLSDSGERVIIVNKRFSNDHKRYTIAHELGHIIMHLSNLVPDYRDKEKEAYRFASEFLMPERYIKSQLDCLRLNNLGKLKEYWLTSFASIVHRARDLRCIDSNRYTNLNIELSRRGYKRHEPLNVFIDTPTVYNDAYKLHKDELGYTDEKLAKAFRLPLDVISDSFSITPLLKIKFNSNRVI
jgi:Zn-dependent peptidase ImmA (M78 family)